MIAHVRLSANTIGIEKCVLHNHHRVHHHHHRHRGRASDDVFLCIFALIFTHNNEFVIVSTTSTSKVSYFVGNW